MADTTLFPIFLETERYVELLDDEQRSKLFMALYTYAKRGEELVTDDRLLLTNFRIMKDQIDRYYKAIDGKKEAGARGGRARVESAHLKQTQAESTSIPIHSNPVLSNPIQSNPEREGASGKPSASRPARKAYGTYKNVLLSDSDHDKFMAERPKDADQLIEAMSCYLKSKGKAYKDYLAALRSWARREDERFQNSRQSGRKTASAGSLNNFKSSFDDQDLDLLKKQALDRTFDERSQS